MRMMLQNYGGYESDFNITEFFPDKFCFFQR